MAVRYKPTPRGTTKKSRGEDPREPKLYDEDKEYTKEVLADAEKPVTFNEAVEKRMGEVMEPARAGVAAGSPRSSSEGMEAMGRPVSTKDAAYKGGTKSKPNLVVVTGKVKGGSSRSEDRKVSRPNLDQGDTSSKGPYTVEATGGEEDGLAPITLTEIKYRPAFEGMTAKSIIEGPQKVAQPKSDSELMPSINVRDIATKATSPQYKDSASMSSSPVPENMKASNRDFEALFKKATGTSFNSKNATDRARMAELRDLVSNRADLADKSDTKVALAWYANKRKK